MNRRMNVVLLSLMLCLCLLPAAGRAAEEPETLMDKAVRLAEDGERLIRMTGDDLLDLIGIDPEDYTDFAYLADTDALSGRELIVLLARDEAAAERMAEQLEHYREIRLRETRNYLPEAYRVLSESEVLREELMVVLSVAAPDPDEAERLLMEE